MKLNYDYSWNMTNLFLYNNFIIVLIYSGNIMILTSQR